MNCGFLVSFAVVTTLAGCATSSDPREGGFFGGVSGINSGAYDTHIEQRQAELIQIQDVNQNLKKESADLKSKAQQQGSELAIERQQMDKMEKHLSELQANLSKLKARSGQQKNEIVALQQKIELVRQQLKSEQITFDQLDRTGDGTTSSDRYRILEKERNRLANEYKMLIEYSKALSDATK